MADLSGMLGTIDAALAQGAPPPAPSSRVQGFVDSIDSTLRQGAPGAPGGPSGYQRTLDALNAALAPDSGDAPGTVTVPYSSGYAGTIAHLDAALSTPPGTRIIMGAPAPLPAGLTPRGASQPDPGSVPPSARLGADRASDAFDPQQPDAGASGASRPLTIRPAQPDAPNPTGPLSNAPATDGCPAPPRARRRASSRVPATRSASWAASATSRTTSSPAARAP